MLKRLPRFAKDLEKNIWSDLNNEIFSSYYDKIMNICDELEEKCNEHEANMPETDSAIEKWEEIHERMEDRLEKIQEIAELLGEIVNNLENGGMELQIIAGELDKLVDYMVEYQEKYKGLAKIT